MSVLIAEDLKLDVMRVGDVFFNEQTIIAECVGGFAPRGLDRMRSPDVSARS